MRRLRLFVHIAHRSFSSSSCPTFEKTIPLSSLCVKGEKDAVLSPVVFMHGLFGNKNNWKSVCRQVSQSTGRTCFSLDLRNHGDSGHTDPKESDTMMMAADVKSWMEREGIPSCILTGHSMGGRVALQFGHLFPSSTDKIIAVDVSPVSIPSSVDTLTHYITSMEEVIGMVDATAPLSIARREADLILASTVEEKLVRDFLIMNLVKGEDGKLRWKFNLHAIKELVSNGLIRRIELKEETAYPKETVFIYGGKSDFVKDSDRPAILKYFPKSFFVSILDAGHYLHVEKPKEFLQALLSVL